MTRIAHVAVLVRDYDEAIAFYSRLGFQVVEDTQIPEQGKRWVTIRPPPPPPPPPPATAPGSGTPSSAEDLPTTASSGSQETGRGPDTTTILLARSSSAKQEVFVGNQTGGRVFLFLATDDFERDFQRFSDAGVEWVRPPRSEPYGKVAVWRDLYGNLWDLVQYH
ncbi:hypothetical protein VTI28DRAFT_2259 [Corynascus sepedonium]